jgi:transcriptional regulator with XRE-family HTH domain
VTDRQGAWLSMGEIIRQQRELAELPMRRLAAMVGISNPYLSQIERGLRAPSEHVLEAIAKSLKTSADALYEQAAAVAPLRPAKPAVVAAIDEDPDLTARQRQALVEVYTALTEATIARRRRGRASGSAGEDGAPEDEHAAADGIGDSPAADTTGPGTIAGPGPGKGVSG